MVKLCHSGPVKERRRAASRRYARGSRSGGISGRRALLIGA